MQPIGSFLKLVCVCVQVLTRPITHRCNTKRNFTKRGTGFCTSDSVTGLDETLRVDWKETCNLLASLSVQAWRSVTVRF